MVSWSARKEIDMITPTSAEQKQLDEIGLIVDKAIMQAVAFYDCRLVLATLIGRTSTFAASLRQAGVADHRMLTRYFMAGLENAFIDNDKVPVVTNIGDTMGEAKQ